MSEAVKRQLAPTGILRGGINTANALLVTGRNGSGKPRGVAPDMARYVGERLGVPVRLVPFGNASQVADGVADGRCGMGLIGAEPARAERIAFTAAYAEIQATYLVPERSSIRSMADVDRRGVKIAVCGGSAYDLWLTRHIEHATIVRAPSVAASYQLFVDGGLDAFAGLRPGLVADASSKPGTRVLDGCFTSVQQAIGTVHQNAAAAMFLSELVDEARRTGLVTELIERHGVRGLTASPPITGR